MIPGGSNDRLTDVDTHNCYICKVAQYLASHEGLLRAFTNTYSLIGGHMHTQPHTRPVADMQYAWKSMLIMVHLVLGQKPAITGRFHRERKCAQWLVTSLGQSPTIVVMDHCPRFHVLHSYG